ncbi:MAG: hypothetical protein AAFU78_22850 [Cyanobacteria bacterium J06633_2]
MNVAATRTRMAHDYYPTPDRLVTELLDHAVDFRQVLNDSKVFEPCAGDGAIARHFPGCITNEPWLDWGNSDREYIPHYSSDATRERVWQAVRPDVPITNPPYESEAMLAILQNAWTYSSKGMAFLIRLGYLEPCQNRAMWLKETSDHLRYWIPINPRPKFRKDVNGTDNVTHAWAVWMKHFSWERQGIDCPFKFITGWK